MNLFEKVEEFKDLDQRARKLHAEMKEVIYTEFVNLKYRITEIEVGSLRDEKQKIKVYYPILDLPEGFSKKDEEFFREFANTVVHKYTLTDTTGKEVKVEEKIIITTTIYESSKLYIQVDKNIFRHVVYKINISEETYNYERVFECNEIVEHLLDNKDVIFTCQDTGNLHKSDEKVYEEYLNALGKTEKIIPLEKLVESQQNEIEINSVLFAKVDIVQHEEEKYIWLKNSKVEIRVLVSCVKNCIELQVQTKNGVKLDSKKFEYWEVDCRDELEKGITLQDLLKRD